MCTIAKVVCAAESQQSAFDFISVDCDLCRSGEVSFLTAKSRGANAYIYMDFCYDGNVTLDCNCDLLWVPWRNRGARSAYSYMDFCCDGNVTLECNCDHGWG